MNYQPELYYIQTLTGFQRISKEDFDKFAFNRTAVYVSLNGFNDEDFICKFKAFIKPSSLFYICHSRNKSKLWATLSYKWLIWLTKNMHKIGFDLEKPEIEIEYFNPNWAITWANLYLSDEWNLPDDSEEE